MRASRVSIILFLNEIKQELLKDGIVKLGLFGSFARDEANVYSDIDIAIKRDDNYLQNRTSYEYFEEIAKIKTLLKKKFHRNSDIFDLDSDSVMKKEIMKDMIYV